MEAINSVGTSCVMSETEHKSEKASLDIWYEVLPRERDVR